MGTNVSVLSLGVGFRFLTRYNNLLKKKKTDWLKGGSHCQIQSSPVVANDMYSLEYAYKSVCCIVSFPKYNKFYDPKKCPMNLETLFQSDFNIS